MAKKPVVDKDLCTGDEVCVSIAPDVFEMDDDGKATVKDSEGDDESVIQTAIDSCPENAISWKEE
ncbi:hypothetical protein AKJ51_02425 [candidate division MSBL1 archaeon SCGC-AAA382A20]|uniref:Ferredoxin n=1 Tax=candidate division MSBL1 archaeon SCGC-AAA382A20 TaxID=1698280 RepID=A0A133VKI1_9EURY|nr:hypothetical protein AKJ51_02425 [candidate division MSBL1 archaeon SCGC-AAA382A20]